MKALLLVGIGGFVGSVARWKLGGLVLHLTAQQRFPYSTFAVNVAGCLVAGVLAGLAEKHDLFGPDAVTILPAISSEALARARMGWPAESVTVLRDHRELIELIKAGEAEKAAELVARHVEGSGRHILEQMRASSAARAG